MLSNAESLWAGVPSPTIPSSTMTALSHGRTEHQLFRGQCVDHGLENHDPPRCQIIRAKLEAKLPPSPSCERFATNFSCCRRVFLDCRVRPLPLPTISRRRRKEGFASPSPWVVVLDSGQTATRRRPPHKPPITPHRHQLCHHPDQRIQAKSPSKKPREQTVAWIRPRARQGSTPCECDPSNHLCVFLSFSSTHLFMPFSATVPSHIHPQHESSTANFSACCAAAQFLVILLGISYPRPRT